MSSRRLAIAAVFGVVVFASKAFAPTPFKDSFIVVQALLLGIAGLLISPLGATFVSTVAGLLLAGWNPTLAFFSVAFSILYGLILDVMLYFLRPLSKDGTLNSKRFVLAVGVATGAIGIIAYGTTLALSLLPRNLIAEVLILVLGAGTGSIGGYLGVLVWRRIGRFLQG